MHAFAQFFWQTFLVLIPFTFRFFSVNVKNVVDIERCWKTRRNLKKLEEAESYRSNRTWMRTNVSFFYSLLEGYFSHEERKERDR